MKLKKPWWKHVSLLNQKMFGPDFSLVIIFILLIYFCWVYRKYHAFRILMKISVSHFKNVYLWPHVGCSLIPVSTRLCQNQREVSPVRTEHPALGLCSQQERLIISYQRCCPCTSPVRVLVQVGWESCQILVCSLNLHEFLGILIMFSRKSEFSNSAFWI